MEATLITQAENVTELLSLLRQNTVGMTNEDAFEYLSQLVGPDIRIRYEITGAAPEPETQEGSDAPSASTLIQDDDDMATRTTSKFAVLNSYTIGRVLLTTKKMQAAFDTTLQTQCNGLLLEYLPVGAEISATWRVLAMPAPMVNPRADRAFAEAALATLNCPYDLYRIKDGTTVNLYWYNDHWRISSSNGFDVTHYEFMGKTDYADALDGLMLLRPDFSYDNLSKSASYSIGFRHKDFHPLPCDPENIWLLQVCDLSDENQSTLAVHTAPNTEVPLTQCGLPWQKPIPVSSFQSSIGSRSSRDTPAEMRDTTIDDYRNDRAHPHYGYVLRVKAECQTMLPPHLRYILIESALLRVVRRAVYDIPKGLCLRRQNIPSHRRVDHNIMVAYITKAKSTLFLDLFPQYRDRYAEIAGEVNDLIESIRKNIIANNFTAAPNDRRSVCIAALAKGIADQCYDFDANHRNASSWIREHLAGDVTIAICHTAILQ